MRKGLSRLVSFAEMKSGKRQGIKTLERLNREAEAKMKRDAILAEEAKSPLGIIRG